MVKRLERDGKAIGKHLESDGKAIGKGPESDRKANEILMESNNKFLAIFGAAFGNYSNVSQLLVILWYFLHLAIFGNLSQFL